jgi:hypothetical protein
LPFVHVPGGEGGELEEGGAGIDEPVDSLARGQLASGSVALDRFLASSERDAGRPLAQLRNELLQPSAAAIVLFAGLHK